MIRTLLLAAAAALTAQLSHAQNLDVEVYLPGTGLLDFPDYDALTPAATAKKDVVSFTEAELFGWEVQGSNLQDDFALRIKGCLLVGTAGLHTFYLTSDDGSMLLIGGKTIVDNGGAHFSETKEGVVALSAGKHTLEVRYFQRNFGVGLSLEWATPDSATRVLVPAASLLEVAPPALGLTVEAYVSSFPWIGNTFPDYAALQPAGLSRAAVVDIDDLAAFSFVAPGITLGNYFALRLVGSVKVEVAGVYTFALTSDDGSQLFVGGSLLVDNGGAHFSETKSAEVELAAGWHTLEIQYFQLDLGARLRLQWVLPGGSVAEVVPEGSLWDSPAVSTAAPSPTPPVTPQPPTTPPPAPPGQPLLVEVYPTPAGTVLMDFPAYSKLAVGLTMYTATVNFPEQELLSWEHDGNLLLTDFGMTVRGSLRVDTAGPHTLIMTSDDGSMLFIDGHQVLDNGGAHMPFEKSVTLNLEAGWHALEIHYFQRDLGAELMLEWQVGSGDVVLIPAENYGTVAESSAALGQQYAAVGSVSGVRQWGLVPVHMAVLPDGRVIGFGSSINTANQVGGDVTAWNPQTEEFSYFYGMFTFNTFCSSVVYSVEEDQMALVGGNTKVLNDDLSVSFFDHKTNTSDASVALAYPRWYGTLVVLHDGRIVVVGGITGTPPGGFNMQDSDVSEIPEIYDPQLQTWSVLPGAGSHDAFGLTGKAWWYPRGYAAPPASRDDDTKVFGFAAEQLWVLDVAGEGTTTVMEEKLHFYAGGSCTSVMYAPGKILVAGGGQGTNIDMALATSETAIVEYHSDTGKVTSRPAAPMQNARNWGTAVVLPHGEVAVLGGTRRYTSYASADWVREVEIWTPPAEGTDGIGSWRTGAKTNKQRLYHSAAVLLPDARVLLGGGGVPPYANTIGNFAGVHGGEVPVDKVPYSDAEVYTPWYLYNADGSEAARPEVVYTGAQPTYGGSIDATLKDGSQTVAQVTVITLPAVTHSHNNAQTFLSIPFVQTGASLKIDIPSRTQLPPGAYYVFAVNDKGVPSEALRINGEVVLKLKP